MNKDLGSKKRMIFILVCVFIGLVLVVCIGGIITQNLVYTPPFKGADGKVIPRSIAEFRRVKLGGNSQAILIRGKSIDNPVLLFLHAGPGLSETGLMRNMNARLEDHYTMVYFDQRGAAKSYSIFNNPKDINTERLLQDIHELTLYLKESLGKKKIGIMAHSFGAGFGALAAARYPQDYSVYIGIAQPVNPSEADRLSYSWAIEQALKNGNSKAEKELKEVNGFWLLKDQEGYFHGMMTNKKWVGYFGGQLVGQKGFMSFVLNNLLCHEFTVFDYAPYLLGMRFSGPASWNIMITTDMRRQATEFQCPFILLTGRMDYNSVPSLVEEYFNVVKAPQKKLYWFDHSSHFPHYEEKEYFQKIMIEELLPISLL